MRCIEISFIFTIIAFISSLEMGAGNSCKSKDVRSCLTICATSLSTAGGANTHCHRRLREICQFQPVVFTVQLQCHPVVLEVRKSLKSD